MFHSTGRLCLSGPHLPAPNSLVLSVKLGLLLLSCGPRFICLPLHRVYRLAARAINPSKYPMDIRLDHLSSIGGRVTTFEDDPIQAIMMSPEEDLVVLVMSNYLVFLDSLSIFHQMDKTELWRSPALGNLKVVTAAWSQDVSLCVLWDDGSVREVDPSAKSIRDIVPATAEGAPRPRYLVTSRSYPEVIYLGWLEGEVKSYQRSSGNQLPWQWTASSQIHGLTMLKEIPLVGIVPFQTAERLDTHHRLVVPKEMTGTGQIYEEDQGQMVQFEMTPFMAEVVSVVIDPRRNCIMMLDAEGVIYVYAPMAISQLPFSAAVIQHRLIFELQTLAHRVNCLLTQVKQKMNTIQRDAIWFSQQSVLLAELQTEEDALPLFEATQELVEDMSHTIDTLEAYLE